MAKQQARTSARKVKDKWKAKGWFNLLAPEMFNRQVIGETPAGRRRTRSSSGTT